MRRVSELPRKARWATSNRTMTVSRSECLGIVASLRRHAVFRFYAELNDFLPPARRFASFAHSFELPASVKDMIESRGVPHTEVDLILLNGEPVDFTQAV